MAIRQIREYGDEILRKKAREVEVVDDKIRELIEDMIETMHKYNGVGLAAPQVGILKRVVNPVIIKQKGKQEVEEGCLSFPNQYAKMIRPEEVVAEALNEKGEKIKIKAKGLLAQAICHELEHLEGILFIDNMVPGTLEYVQPEETEGASK